VLVDRCRTRSPVNGLYDARDVTDNDEARLAIGTRVRVRRDPTFPGPWPAEPLGTIIPWPAELAAIAPDIKGGELFRMVEHRSGPERYRGPQREYFVEFDEPQFDTDGPEGGGPYRSASVWERYLEPIAAD
jgi:hypothetical protein